MTQIMSKYRILNNLKMLKSKTLSIPFSSFLKVFIFFPADHGTSIIISLLDLFYSLGI